MTTGYGNKITTRGRSRPRPPAKSSSTTAAAAASCTTHVEFQSVLRIRPFLKKEKDDHVVLEQSTTNASNSKNRSSNNNNNNSNAAAAVAVLPPMVHLTSPDGGKRLSGNLSSPKFIQEGRQETFHFDKILNTSSTQDNVYYSIGLVMATNAMEPLKKQHKQQQQHHQHAAHNNNNNKNINSHLGIVMGVSSSGKTHSTFGNLKALGKPGRNDDDGLVPRILESLFSQSKHHISKKRSFAVRLTLVNVENDTVHDLLKETTMTSGGGGSNVDSTSTPLTLSAKRNKSAVMAMVASLEGGGGGGSSGNDKNMSNEVTIEQDATTYDFVTDATLKTCWSSAEAREVLHAGLNRGLSSRFGGLAKGSSRGHTLVVMQPVLIRGSSSPSDFSTAVVDKCGGTIAFLDMASVERVKKSRGATPLRDDAIANNSAYSAVLHCLRGIKHNRDVMTGKISCDVDDDADADDLYSEISCVSEPKAALNSKHTIKAVPYRQSKVTMLLQPLFSPTAEWNADRERTTTVVTTLLTAYPGHRDYAEKRSMLIDLEQLLGSDIAKKRTPAHAVNTGLDVHSPTHQEYHRGTTMQDTIEGIEEVDSLDMDDSVEDSDKHHFQSPRIPPVVVPMAPIQDYDIEAIPISVEEAMAPLPPPYAPGAFVEATAPLADSIYPTKLKSIPTVAATPVASIPSSTERRTCVVDLPGVTLPQTTLSAIPASRTQNFRPTPPPPTTKRAPLQQQVESVSKTVPLSSFTSPPLAPLSNFKKASTLTTPNIQPPPPSFASRKLNNPLSSRKESPSRGWMNTSPMKNVSRAVNSTKKKGKRAIDMVDRAITERSSSKRLSNEFEPKAGSSNDALLQRLKVLETQNVKLTKENAKLNDKCNDLIAENEKLKRAMQATKMNWRKECWTLDDEQEWQHSKRLRLDEQRLIRSPLWQHLEHVQYTDDISNKWVQSGKEPFVLQFPTHWKRARDLDERDRTV